MKTHAIGMFDSGVGGLTVMRQMMHTLPCENIVYFGDTARVPYGEKSRDTILRYSIENAHFLLEKQIKVLVIACNTASAFAAEEMKKQLNIPIVEVIQPGVDKALEVTRSGRIGILGTKATIRSEVYQNKLKEGNAQVSLTAIACPLLVPLVEEKLISHEATTLLLREYLAPLKKDKVDTLLLGCTHYPLLQHLIAQEMGADVTIVDSASTCSHTLACLLKSQGLEASHTEPEYAFYVSDDPEKFKAMGETFLEMPMKVSLKP